MCDRETAKYAKDANKGKIHCSFLFRVFRVFSGKSTKTPTVRHFRHGLTLSLTQWPEKFRVLAGISLAM
ncbi:MAG: hypothetical protein DMF68_13975 [Acidobacteria bacterium]|nr:MAG: hypothetical protein DMF68_13975 [Acidobacteriota bacterium]